MGEGGGEEAHLSRPGAHRGRLRLTHARTALLHLLLRNHEITEAFSAGNPGSFLHLH